MQDKAIQLSMEIIDTFKNTQLMVDRPSNLQGSQKMPLVQAFLNDFGMYLVMIAGVDHHIYPVSPLEAKYIMDIARIRMNVDTIVQLQKVEDLGRGGKYSKTVPSSFKAIIENNVIPVKFICRLYAASAMNLITVDHKPNSEELLSFIEYRDMMLDYLKTKVNGEVFAECEEEFDHKKHWPEEKAKDNPIPLGTSGDSLKSRSQVIEDIRKEYADIYMNCDIPTDFEKTGTDNLMKILAKDMKDYVIFLASSNGEVTDGERAFLKDFLDVDMTLNEIKEYIEDNNLSPVSFSKQLPRTFSICVAMENVQSSMQKIMPGRRVVNMNIGTTEKLATLYLKLGITMGIYSGDGNGPDMNAYTGLMTVITDYIKENLGK